MIITDDYIKIETPSGDFYSIPIKTAKTTEEKIFWICHIHEKSWVRGYQMKKLLEYFFKDYYMNKEAQDEKDD